MPQGAVRITFSCASSFTPSAVAVSGNFEIASSDDLYGGMSFIRCILA